jgi:hypothetical protein
MGRPADEQRRDPGHRSLIAAYFDWYERLPYRTRQALLALLAVLVVIDEFHRRGWIVGLIALATWGAIVVLSTTGRDWFARMRERPLVRFADGLLLIPLAFLALALSTRLSLAICALAGVGAWLVVRAIGLARP